MLPQQCQGLRTNYLGLHDYNTWFSEAASSTIEVHAGFSAAVCHREKMSCSQHALIGRHAGLFHGRCSNHFLNKSMKWTKNKLAGFVASYLVWIGLFPILNLFGTVMRAVTHVPFSQRANAGGVFRYQKSKQCELRSLKMKTNKPKPVGHRELSRLRT